MLAGAGGLSGRRPPPPPGPLRVHVSRFSRTAREKRAAPGGAETNLIQKSCYCIADDNGLQLRSGKHAPAESVGNPSLIARGPASPAEVGLVRWASPRGVVLHPPEDRV